MGTSLWLVPSPSSPEATALQDVILSISKAHTSPCFPPHITLASLPASTPLADIVACFPFDEGLEISFETVRTGQTYFQSVFAVVQATPGLIRLHEHVHKTLGVQPKTPEFAHLSLYYGDRSKEEIAQGLQVDEVVKAAYPQGGISIGGVRKFAVEEVWVVTCEGMPEKWIVVEKINLSK